MDSRVLYKLSATGAVQEWTIWVEGATIHTRYGQKDGKMQTTSDTVKGKNLGKKNETTGEQQAIKEAVSRWEKQIKKGYVVDIARAKEAETDHVGGITPMLAHKYSEHGHKVRFPAYCQPKLDGIRCIATITPAGVTLWTRTRKPINSVPHINRAIGNLGLPVGAVLDGELYNHRLRKDFEKIVSLVRQDQPGDGHEMVEYHIYDYPSVSGGFNSRWAAAVAMELDPPLVLVKTETVDSEDKIMGLHAQAIADGYEGLMVRNSAGAYEGKRSYNLQKIKEFDDAEFKIIGVNEGRGKLAGHAATFTCVTSEGSEFEVKLTGDTERLKDYLRNDALWRGKWLTVKYQGFTNSNNVPRFPVGISIRDYE